MDDLVKRLRHMGERVPISCPDNKAGCLVYHYRIETDPTCAEAADRIEELERKVERLTYDGIHTCSDQCERLVCVLRRQIEELESWKAAEEVHHHLLKRRIAELEAAIREITGT